MIRITISLVLSIWVEHMVQWVTLVTAMDAVIVHAVFINTSWMYFSLKHDYREVYLAVW